MDWLSDAGIICIVALDLSHEDNWVKFTRITKAISTQEYIFWFKFLILGDLFIT